ncbi:MAG: hypothetical protein HY548_06895 [Elusimicrobia bacterium]|nr:hypothetical protein [Elusimicrobiota bacterium]
MPLGTRARAATERYPTKRKECFPGSWSAVSGQDVNTADFYVGTASHDGGRGQGSYPLQKVTHPKNGDPMIVLDGESYVTGFAAFMTLRRRWLHPSR